MVEKEVTVIRTIEIDEEKDKTYSCECGFNPEMLGIEAYNVRDGIIVDMTGLYDSKPVYPKIINERSYAGEFSGTEWEEVNFCPICKEEYSFWNSNV